VNYLNIIADPISMGEISNEKMMIKEDLTEANITQQTILTVITGQKIA